ncbi:MAG: hypothetical protein BWX88_02075 [Planctomycetes bacterium ADurb.Bin126]|nr:MAG: hypothetical protein BWX88_02075 [Planctomycetes bacterium ADurb.Bin126]HOD81865.1 hypothetical protein [Phycisphaerae bacterium]HQL75761.1 hypothetical protein [Phycisphaerae bacterium]
MTIEDDIPRGHEDYDDPRLTAYALGELDGPERERFEREARAEPALQRELEQIRLMAATLTAELEAEPGPVLSEAQQAALARAAQPPGRRTLRMPSRATGAWRTYLAMAAGVMIVASLGGLLVYSLFLPPPSPRVVGPDLPPQTGMRKATYLPTPGLEQKAPVHEGTQDDDRPGHSSAPVGHTPLALELPRAQFIGTPEDIRHLRAIRPPRVGERTMPMVPADVFNVARGKPVTASDTTPVLGELKMITDGRKEGSNAHVELAPGRQWVRIDLLADHEIFAVVVWHYFLTARVYHDVVIQTADDAAFTANVRTIFNNDRDNSLRLGIGYDTPYVDNHEGELVVPRPVARGRYVRLWSNGNTSNDLNHYVEVEVYARPVK